MSSTALQTLLDTGFAALAKGELEHAASCCQQALELQPELVPAHFLVGLTALEANDRTTAFSAFQSAVRLDKHHAAAWAQLAKLYTSDGQIQRADAALRETLRIRPTDPVVLDLIGATLSLMGKHEAANAFFVKANSSQANHPPFMQNLANNWVTLGDSGAAKALFKEIIALQPHSPQAHWGLAASATVTADSHIKEMQDLAARHKNDARALGFYQYAIGKECEDLQQWKPAFAAFAAGAAARRETVAFDEPAEIEMFQVLEEHFTRDWFDSLPAGNPDASPIFVVGQPRTGTTLVERIIAAHSQVYSAGELQQFGMALRRLSNYTNPKRFSAELFIQSLTLEPTKVGGLYLQSIHKMRGNTPDFVDKLPQNYLLIPLILKALPNAKIVHLVRDPMDACFASFKQLFADAYLHSYEQGEMARHHARYRHLMAVWHERFGERIFDVRYEAIASDLEPNARGLINHLELPWEDACLDFHNQAGPVSTASAAQVREPAHTRSIGRWRQYENQLAPMASALKDAGVIWA